MYKRITVFGCCGCGKTTLAKEIHNITHIPLINLDYLNWRNNWTPVPESEFDLLLANELQKESWIIEGLYNRTISARINSSDTIIYMDFSRIFCIVNVIKRVIKNYGKCRDGMPDGCFERFDFPFLKCIWKYNKKYRKKYLEMLNNTKDKNIIIIRSKKERRLLIDDIKRTFEQCSIEL